MCVPLDIEKGAGSWMPWLDAMRLEASGATENAAAEYLAALTRHICSLDDTVPCIHLDSHDLHGPNLVEFQPSSSDRKSVVCMCSQEKLDSFYRSGDQLSTSSSVARDTIHHHEGHGYADVSRRLAPLLRGPG